MKTDKKLQIQQFDDKINGLAKLAVSPAGGWVRSLRSLLNMSLQQLGTRMGIAAQSVMDIEKSEKAGTISIKTLHKVAKSLDMKLVYGFLPNDGSFEKMIEKQALTTARTIVMRTNTFMKLEDQQVSKERLEKAIKELAEQIMKDLPRYLWS